MNANIRFFATVNINEEIQDVEITRECFEWLASTGAQITYDCHTVYNNDLYQIVLTIDSYYDAEDLSLV